MEDRKKFDSDHGLGFPLTDSGKSWDELGRGTRHALKHPPTSPPPPPSDDEEEEDNLVREEDAGEYYSTGDNIMSVGRNKTTPRPRHPDEDDVEEEEF